jgi:protein phosphatase/serine/threonine-protein phosphatase Stp1
MGDTGMERSVIAHGRFRCWGASHNGSVRDHNEDRFVNRPDLGMFAVADGAGGHDHGQVASSLVAEYLQGVPEGLHPGELLKEIKGRLMDAHDALREKAAQLREGAVIATTVVALIVSERHYACLWVGDSRIYLLRENTLVRVTRDHSLVQELIDAGAITEDQAEHHPRANIITRAIGADADELDVDMVFDRLFPGDRFLLCSDGVTKCLDEPLIAGILGADDDAPAERLILAALARHATDNITAVTVQVVA